MSFLARARHARGRPVSSLRTSRGDVLKVHDKDDAGLRVLYGTVGDDSERVGGVHRDRFRSSEQPRHLADLGRVRDRLEAFHRPHMIIHRSAGVSLTPSQSFNIVGLCPT